MVIEQKEAILSAIAAELEQRLYSATSMAAICKVAGDDSGMQQNDKVAIDIKKKLDACEALISDVRKEVD